MTTMHVSISKGNSKMGAIASVSLPAYTTCRKNAPCYKKCYAAKLARFRTSVQEAYERNWKIYQEAPEQYWREVESAIMMVRFFRFHVSGDIPSLEYLEKMVELAARNAHCKILCFTKQFEIVNEFLAAGGVLPENLQIIFSGWVGLEMPNPFGLPEAHVIFRDGTTTASDGAIFCSGNCAECAKSCSGCWSLKPGQQVLFREH